MYDCITFFTKKWDINVYVANFPNYIEFKKWKNTTEQREIIKTYNDTEIHNI